MIDRVFESGIAIILWLQGLGDWPLAPARFFSFLGTEEFFLLVLPASYWCLSAVFGLRLGLLLLLSNGLNAILKLAFASPRPFWYSPEVRPLAYESSFGTPSGHAQNGATIWLFLATVIRRTWAFWVLTVLVFLIGLSRMVLGVHFPVDVVAGWIFGLFLLWIYLRLEAPLMAWLTRYHWGTRVLIALAASVLIVLIGVLVRLGLGDYQLPVGWAENAAAAFPQEDPIDPLSLDGLFTSAGALFGLAAGAIWLFAGQGFNAGGPWWMRLLRYPIGLIGVVVLWFGLGAVFPRGDFALAYALRYLRYALVGLWVAALAPLLFMRLRLAHPPRLQEEAVQAREIDG